MYGKYTNAVNWLFTGLWAVIAVLSFIYALGANGATATLGFVLAAAAILRVVQDLVTRKFVKTN